MKLTDEGERKVQLELADICSFNTTFSKLKSCLFFGEDYQIALKTLRTLDEVRDPTKTFFTVYDYVHFIPVNAFGVRLLRVLTHPHAIQIILKRVFKGKTLSDGTGDFTYDAEGDGIFYLNFLDSDISKLRRFRQYLPENVKWIVVAYVR